jgi:hypothetical protein
MQHSQKKRELDIEGKIASGLQFLDRRSNTGLLPKTLEDQRLDRYIALARYKKISTKITGQVFKII